MTWVTAAVMTARAAVTADFSFVIVDPEVAGPVGSVTAGGRDGPARRPGRRRRRRRVSRRWTSESRGGMGGQL